MFRAIVIGNLGSDAKVEVSNGRAFVSFSVAHNDRFTSEDGTVKEKVQWISCAMNGDGGKLLQFLKKGRQVYVEGRASTRCYSSEKERRFVAGVNISVDHLELIGSTVDEVPRVLHDEEGVMHSVHKCYYLKEEDAEEVLAGRSNAKMLDSAGAEYIIFHPCWVRPVKQDDPEQQATVEVFDGEQANEVQAEMQRKVSTSKKEKK